MNSFETFPRVNNLDYIGSMREKVEANHSKVPFSTLDWHYVDNLTRSSSPETSIRSGHSSPSEPEGDSGVSSDHETPPPKTRKPISKKLIAPFDFDNDSSSSEINIKSNRTRKPRALLSKDIKDNFPKRKPTSKFIDCQKKVPECLLSEIKEKWKELRKKRCNQNPEERSIICNRTSSFHKSSRYSPRLHSPLSVCSSLSVLSLSDSSRHASMTSLATEDEDYFPNKNTPNFNRTPLFECRDESAAKGFAGLNDIFAPQQESTIKSSKGTVRGVKNRVRAGIATFTSDHRLLKVFMEREKGKVTVYVTTLGVVRDTFERCLRLRKILWTLLVRFEERDVFMARETQIQLLDRLQASDVTVPHVFMEGQYLGNAELIERLNETGELRRLLHPYMRPATTTQCSACGGFRLLPCGACSGSKKSLHRNNFTLEFVALKCSACDESGLIPCATCFSPA